MITAAVFLGLALAGSFAVLLWKSPKRIRAWLLKRSLTLDAAFTAFCLLLTIPTGGLGPTTLIGISVAGLTWTIGLWLMQVADERGWKLPDLKGYIPFAKPVALLPAPVR